MFYPPIFNIISLHKLVNNKRRIDVPIIIPRQCGNIGRILDQWMSLLFEYRECMDDIKDSFENINVYRYTKYREIMPLNKIYIIPKYNKNFKKKVIDEWLEKLK